MTIKIDNIPVYLRAKSPRVLQRLMLKNNIKHSANFDYKVMPGPDGLWYAWYKIDILETLDEKGGE